MKIAIFHELHFGGAKRAVFEYGKRLQIDNSVDLYYIDSREDREALRYFDQAQIYYFPFSIKKWRGNAWTSRLYKDSIELIKLYFLHKRIAYTINRNNYDFVFVHPSKFTQAPFLLRFLQGNSVYYCQEPLRIVYDTFISRMKNIPFHKRAYEVVNRWNRKFIDLLNCKSAKIVFANSIYSQKNIRQAYGIHAKLCYLGVDHTVFRPIKCKKEYNILFIGNRTEVDGYDILEAMTNLFPRKLKIKVIEDNFEKPISDLELVHEYNKSEIVLVLSHNEPFGLIPLEAMACGVPVVAVNEGGYRESIIHGKTGLLIKRDARELANTIKKLLHNNTFRRRIGKNARKIVEEKWTWEKSLHRLLNILSEEVEKN